MSCDKRYDIQLYKNKTKRWELVFTDDGAAINISDYTIYFIVKLKKADADSSALLTKTITSHTDAVNGKTEIYLSKSDTNSLLVGEYWYSIEFNDGESGTDLDEDVLQEGKLTVLRPTRIG